jgi:hypothetical protein
MRPVPVPTREELGEGGWIIAAAETVINPVFAEKGLKQCYSEEGVGDSMLQNRAI